MNKFFKYLMILLLISYSSTLSAYTVYYSGSNEYKYAVWYWCDGSEGQWAYWMEECDASTLYVGFKIYIPSSCYNLIFVTFDKSQSKPNWSDKLYQTADLKYDGSHNYYDGNKWQNLNIDLYNVSVHDLLLQYDRINLSEGETSSDNFTVFGYVTSWKSGYPDYDNGDFFIGDEYYPTDTIRCYRLRAKNSYGERKLKVGEYLKVEGYLKNYKGHPEIVNGNFEVLYALIIYTSYGGTVKSSLNGTYCVSTYYYAGTQVVIEAIPDEGYKFTEWSDGNTDSRRTLTMNTDYSLTAYFEKETTEDCLYGELNGKKSAELLVALNSMISSHKTLSYTEVGSYIKTIDQRSDRTIWDMYSNCTFYSSNNCGYGTFDECECYNREHSIPKSWWGQTTSESDEPMYTDLHHIIPTDYSANSQRGAWAYGEVRGTPDWSNSLGSKLGETNTYSGGQNKKVFEPVDEYKGDIARIYFYMITCYRNKNFTKGGQGYRMFTYNNSTSEFTPAAQTLLINWHRKDPVSQKEKKRNDHIANIQGNRNPFVDDPSLVEYIWGQYKGKGYDCSGESTSIETTQEAQRPEVIKIIENGQFYIVLPSGKRYNVLGMEIK